MNKKNRLGLILLPRFRWRGRRRAKGERESREMVRGKKQEMRKMEDKEGESEPQLNKKIERCYVYNIFTTNHRWLVAIGSNLKLTLRLLFCSNNNN